MSIKKESFWSGNHHVYFTVSASFDRTYSPIHSWKWGVVSENLGGIVLTLNTHFYFRIFDHPNPAMLKQEYCERFMTLTWLQLGDMWSTVDRKCKYISTFSQNKIRPRWGWFRRQTPSHVMNISFVQSSYTAEIINMCETFWWMFC